jgi:hypothetical protein
MKTKQIQNSERSDAAAKAIASFIIRWKIRLANALNGGVNQLSSQQQKWLLLAFCCLCLAGQLLTFFQSGNPTNTQSQHNRVQTDSSMLNNQSNGKSTANRLRPGKK